jgi:serine/threonine-protein kinase
MSSSHHDLALLQLAIGKGLVAPEAVNAVLAQVGDHPLMEALVESGAITAQQVQELRQEHQRRTHSRLVGDFEVLGRIGKGGMASVFRAIEKSTGRRVALKVISARFADRRPFVDRFLREAKSASAVSHPNLVGCYAYGEWHGRVYMVLEYVSSGTAATLAESEGGRLSEARALRLARDGAHGLEALYQAGLIHRDIKPANIFIDHLGNAKLADFGLARTVSQDDRLTQAGTVMGTPSYMAPEQIRAQDDIDIRADIYALGASLYQLVTGVTPFTGGTPYEVMANVLNAPLADPRQHLPDLSPEGAAIILRAMAYRREDRYQEPRALAEDLEAALAGRPLPHAAKRGWRQALRRRLAGSSRLQAGVRRRRLLPTLVIVLVFLAVFAALWFSREWWRPWLPPGWWPG